jgi:hypothetical protein
MAVAINGCSEATGKSPESARGPCELDTGYAGDDTCLTPPDPSVGTQFHYGPSDHDDPDEVATYLIEPGIELVDCAFMDAPNPERVYFREFQNSLRPGSHHLLVNAYQTDVEDGRRACGEEGPGNIPRLLGGTTVARGRAGSTPPEDEGLADYLEGNAQIGMQLHYFNTSEAVVLREAWMNITYMDESDVKQVMEPIQGYGNVALSVPSGANQVWRSSMTAPNAMRIVDVYSHFHANTVRMTAWKIDAADGKRSVLYESFSWDESPTLPLNSVDVNPLPDEATRRSGGTSGIVELVPGDVIEWECEIHNRRSITLTFANKALDGDMCNFRGNYAPSWGKQWFTFVGGVHCTSDEVCPR